MISAQTKLHDCKITMITPQKQNSGGSSREEENSNKIPAEARVKKGNAAPADVKKASKTGQKGVSKASKKGVCYLGVHRQPKKMLTWDSDDSLAGPRAKRSKKGRAKGQAK